MMLSYKRQLQVFFLLKFARLVSNNNPCVCVCLGVCAYLSVVTFIYYSIECSLYLKRSRQVYFGRPNRHMQHAP